MSVLVFGPSLFIQPHYDDVPLSCGGTLALLAESGYAPRMVTVFASELVDEMVGEFAAWKHERWKVTDAEEVLAVRRAEDTEAARALGSSARKAEGDLRLIAPSPQAQRLLRLTTLDRVFVTSDSLDEV